MKALLLVASLSGCAIGCEGAPFSLPADVGLVGLEDAGTDTDAGEAATQAPETAATDAATPDAGELSDAVPLEAAALDAAQPDAPAVCSPVTVQPAAVCPHEPSVGIFPANYPRMASAPPAGCPSINAYEPTPSQCQCVETFNCACLKANGVPWKNCEDLGGAPWVY